MTTAEAARLLTLAAAYDRRTIGEADATAWADALHGLRAADCAEAIRRHYRDSRDWIMPADIRHTVRKLRADRIRAVPTTALEPADVDPNDIEAYQEARLTLIRSIADGNPPPQPPALPKRNVQALLTATANRLPQP